MNNQECKVRPLVVNVNGDDTVFFLIVLKQVNAVVVTTISIIHAHKNLNVKVFNLVSGTDETRRIEWHETYKCKYRFERSVCNNKQRWNNDKCRCECKELIDKGVCDKGFIWNPKNCEWECYKSFDFSECLDNKNCKCKKRLADKLVEECTENNEEMRLVETNSSECNSVENKWKHNSCRLYIVLFSVFFRINVRIGISFLYFHWYLKKRCYSC